VQHAAAELAAYLEAMSGAQVPVVVEDVFAGTTRIDVGPTTVARAAQSEEARGHPESVTIRSTDDGVVICGGSDRGTLFGVYRLLEQVLGCRWLAPGHEYVPSRETVSVPAISHESVPAFDLRTFSCRDPEHMVWGLKVGLNGFYTAEAANENGGCYYSTDDMPFTHTWHKIIPHAKYAEEHPEWFPLLDGKRVPSRLHNAQLCVTADGLAEEFAKNVVAAFDADPACRIASISPNDGYGWCECDACEALDERLCGKRTTQQGLAKARRFRGDRVFWFANEVARRVAKKHPDKLLLMLAYVNYAEPPDTVRPLPNVVPWLCHYAPADYSRPISDPSSEPNRQFNELLTAWAEICPHLLFYAYVSKSMWWELPRPVLRPFAADVKHLHALGLSRYYAQSSLSHWALDGPLYYVLAKLLWEPALEPQDVAQDWIDHMFGPAAPDMAAFYRAVDDAVRKTGQSYSDNPRRDVPGLYHRPDLDRAREALDRAATATGDATISERIQEAADTFLYGYHMIQCFEAVDLLREGKGRDAVREAKAFGQKALRYRKVRKAQDFVEALPSYANLGGVMTRGFGPPEERGGRRCWNSDETGPGDDKSGWAAFYVDVPDPSRPVTLEMDVWGESRLASIVVHNGAGKWNGVRPRSRLSGEPTWETLVFAIPPELMAGDKAFQEIGFGGGDSQVWVAAIRAAPAAE